jgi:hypothetical protein
MRRAGILTGGVVALIHLTLVCNPHSEISTLSTKYRIRTVL